MKSGVIDGFLLNPKSPQSHGLSKCSEMKVGLIAGFLLSPSFPQCHGLSKFSKTKEDVIPGLLLNPPRPQYHGLSEFRLKNVGNSSMIPGITRQLSIANAFFET